LNDAFNPGNVSDADNIELSVDLVKLSEADEVAAAITHLADTNGAPEQGLVGLAAAIAQGEAEATEDGFQVEGLAVVTDEASSTVHWLSRPVLYDPAVVDSVVKLVGADGPGIVAHDAKPIIRAFMGLGIDLEGLRLDTSLAAYLLDPSGNSYPLDELLALNTEYRMPDDDGPPSGQLDFGEQTISPALRAARDALAAARLGPELAASLEADGLSELNETVEVPLVRVLARMEHLGVGVDRGELEALNADMTAEAETLAAQIQTDAGEEFNVNSTKKLREILFEKLELTPQKKTKTG
ncbi:MAG: hypothetical protein GY773_31655, partial [Actinomycetia bacterium]|nr:hypothetical protein [Actinomycetes bacterium]